MKYFEIILVFLSDEYIIQTTDRDNILILTVENIAVHQSTIQHYIDLATVTELRVRVLCMATVQHCTL